MTETRSVPQLVPCAPPKWARGGHLQTILGHILPSPALREKGERLELEVTGGDRLVAHFYPGRSRNVVYLFHGLGGSAQSTYIQRTALLARDKGHSVFVFNHRGCGEGAKLAREPYHSGRAEDLSALIREGRRRLPEHRHVAIGFSLSANALLLLAAGQRAEVLPDAAIAVNAPIDLRNCSRLLGTGLNRVYDFRFMQDMRREIRDRAHLDPELSHIKIARLASIWDFDDLYTAPRGGFRDREHYYATCSANQYLKDIAIPTIVLTAKDDPFVDYRDYETARLSPHVHMRIEESGGHMGYLTATPTPLNSQRWLDYALLTYLESFTLS